MPKAARERIANPRAGTALAPLSKVPSRRRPSMSEMMNPIMISDKCQAIVALSVTTKWAD
jgi:hypothetical protein